MKMYEYYKKEIEKNNNNFALYVLKEEIIPFCEQNQLTLDYGMGGVFLHRWGVWLERNNKVKSFIKKINAICEDTEFASGDCDSIWWILSRCGGKLPGELRYTKKEGRVK